MLDSGELQRLISLGIVGITSNPTIFMKAITGSNDYDDRIQNLLDEGAVAAPVNPIKWAAAR